MPNVGARLLRRFGGTLERALGRAATDFIGEKLNPDAHDERRGMSQPSGASERLRALSASPSQRYPGDFHGVPDMAYRPRPDGQPDPGEIVWTWVPFVEDPTRGKDRPVLVVATDGPWLLVVPLTSKDHDRDTRQERAAGREWVDIGSGPWDADGRASEVRINRIVRVDPGAVRREGAVLARAHFEAVAAAIRADAGRQR